MAYVGRREFMVISGEMAREGLADISLYGDDRHRRANGQRWRNMKSIEKAALIWRRAREITQENKFIKLAGSNSSISGVDAISQR